MDSLVYSLNATLPVFFVMVAGYIFRRMGILSEEFVKSADKFNFKVTLPLLLFTDLATNNIKDIFDGRYALFCAAVTTLMFFGTWIGAKIFIRDKSITGAFVQASYRSSVAILGLAFITNIYDSPGMAPIMLIGSVPLYNIYAVLVLTFESSSSDSSLGEHIKKSIINIIKNPIIIGIVLGLLVGLSGIKLPHLISKPLTSIGAIASPLTLIAIGAGFEGKKALAKIKPTFWASAIKLVIQPLIFLPIAVKLGFTGEQLIAILIMLAAPATPSCYIMAKNMKNDGVLTASIVVMTTLLAAFTLTGWIYLLKLLALI